MKHRKLRIAWSVVWGIAAVLLIVLWVRSYLVWDNSSGRQMTPTTHEVLSIDGRDYLRYAVNNKQRFSGSGII